jgi:hypothetical protein
MRIARERNVWLASGLALSLGLVLAGCSSETEKKPCPAKGIGVAAASGQSCRDAASSPTSADYKDCLDQVENYKNYSCEEPQICPDRGKVIRLYTLSGTAAGEEVSFVLTNCSTGTQALNVTKMIVYGDTRCSFSDAEYGDAGTGSSSPNEAAPGESIAIRTIYKPKTVGQDFAAISITANAKNFSPLSIAVCGAALPYYPAGKDSSVAAADSSSTDSSTSPLKDCKEVGTTVTSSCHKN